MQFLARRAATNTASNLRRMGAVGALFATSTTFAFASGAEQTPTPPPPPPQVCPVNHGKPQEKPQEQEAPMICPVNHGKPTTTEEETPMVCPIVHTKPVEETPMVCPIIHTKPAEEAPMVCPINHTKPTEEAPMVCPINHTKPAEEAPKVCPVNRGQPQQQEKPKVCPVKHDAGATKPKVCPVKHSPDGDRYVDPNQAQNMFHNEDIHQTYDISKIEFPNARWGFVIPATGRGNSDDGAHWVNPTPLELFRACHAKDEDRVLGEETALDIADVHNFVVSSSWAALMDWEEKYMDNGTCPDGPTLTGFGGKQDKLTPKAYFFTTFLTGAKVYDRHDWFIDRCGTKVRYILDYYDDGEGGVGSVDVRPALDSPQAFFDRAEKTITQFKNGDQWW